MPTDGLATTGRKDAARLELLREAARVGLRALDRGESKEFGSFDDLEAYLNGVSERLIVGAAE
ncbi:MAG: hypothetical protein ACLPKB_22990 [Xanthobacteraceae bacterium]